MNPKKPRSHGDGRIRRRDFASLGKNVIFERGAMVFHPENIIIGDNVYLGHGAMLKAYFKNRMEIGDGTWIGQMAFLHSAGGLRIGRNVGIAPGVMILTSWHEIDFRGTPMIRRPIRFAPVTIDEGADIGAGAIITPGIRIGREAQVGAGAVVTRNVKAFSIVAGNPARVLRLQKARSAQR